ncbi:2-hydroxy-3-oxopropionate reductase [Candidatus Rhodobacter oscarellae]|uniref:2-hydroxy-3-oxopropionate reductase n=2 Tax=Candidatus Rhodobacter oscarellae TaxID=1675527 RepID=A0A0J9E4G6_9RHOB|nr:2-hydroxy-3-oxopropionate reductase [Candidatus Rhodobacter lobularis]
MGLMGLPMALRLLAAGYEVIVWNRSTEKCGPAVDAGARLATNPAEVAAQSDLLLMCLTNAKAVEAVLFGPSGVASAEHVPEVLIDFSSIHPETTKALAERLASETGTAWLDAPVSGGTPAAKAGTLTIMVGGRLADFDQVQPVLKHLAQNVTHMGPTGTGQMTKLVNQVISGCTMVLVAEAVNLAEEAGVDATRLAQALGGGFADSKPFQLLAPRMSARDFEDPLGAVATMQKDLVTVCDVGETVGASMPMTENALRLLNDTAKDGHADADISTVILTYKRDR